MNRNLLIIIWSMLAQHSLSAQSKWGFENYHYLDQPATSAIVPVIHFQAQKGMYAALRYNYEAAQTMTLLGGKTFGGGSSTSYSITPMTGFSVGLFTGITFAINAEVEWRNFYFSSETQQSVSTKMEENGFFFSWSELAYDFTDHFFGGVSMQYTLQQGNSNLEPGIVAGVNFKKFSFPCYVFNPFREGTHVVLGVNYQWSFKRKQ